MKQDDGTTTSCFILFILSDGRALTANDLHD
jgi:hypothetical protein